MSEPTLRVIAQELVCVIKGNVTVDWMHRDSACAIIRRHRKRPLRKFGYPHDLQGAAVQKVLQQVEARRLSVREPCYENHGATDQEFPFHQRA